MSCSIESGVRTVASGQQEGYCVSSLSNTLRQSDVFALMLAIDECLARQEQRKHCARRPEQRQASQSPRQCRSHHPASKPSSSSASSKPTGVEPCAGTKSRKDVSKTVRVSVAAEEASTLNVSAEEWSLSRESALGEAVASK